MKTTMRLRHVAPAGAPIGVADLFRAARLSLSTADTDRLFRQAICRRFSVRHCFLTSTGRAGMTALLRAMRRLVPSTRDEVVLPSYTCFSLAASTIKAGLRPRIVDVDPATLDYDPQALAAADMRRVVAIVATNLYGLPNDLVALGEFARAHGVFLIDDAAQSMGASASGRWCGTWGDAGLFSLDKGKNVSSIDGGIVVTSNPEVADAMHAEMASLPLAAPLSAGAGITKALVYSSLLRPSLYWIPNGIPALELGKTVFTTEFPVSRPSRPLVALGATMLGKLEGFTAKRRANAALLLEGLRGLSGVRTITPVPGSAPAYLRLPLLIEDSRMRDALVTALTRAGIGATTSYPSSLVDVPELAQSDEAAAGGRYVAQHILTLPTHPFVTRADVARILTTIRGALPLEPAGRVHPDAALAFHRNGSPR